MCYRPTTVRDLDGIGLALLVLSTVAALLLVPDLTVAVRHPPTFGAIVGGGLTLMGIVVLRGRGRRGTRLERVGLAVFLSLMPTVYLSSRLLYGTGSSWLWLELAGQLVFVALAVAGVRASPWFLVVGLAAHGLSDAAHYGRTPFVPDWYAVACAVVDLPWAVYVATQVPAWRSARVSASRLVVLNQ